MKRLRLLGGIVFVVSLLWTAGIIFSTPKAEAATLNVVAGTDAIVENGQCQLSEAIQNINDIGQTHTDCIAGDGNNDTINLPSGMITLSADLPGIQQSITIQGQGMGETIVNGAGLYEFFHNFNSGTYYLTSIDLQNMTLTAWSGMLLKTGRGDVSLMNVEVDGSGANVGTDGVMTIGNVYTETNNVVINNIHVHDIVADDNYIHIMNVWCKDGGTTYALADEVTINNITNTGGGINVMVWGVGVMRTENAFGSFNGKIRNTTIDNVFSSTGTASIVSMSAVSVENETATTEVIVENVTISNVDSGTSIFGVDGSFGSFGASLDETTNASANLIAKNVIISNNSYGGDSQSCGSVSDISFLVGGSGNPNTSISSSGGNISDDDSCSTYFTDPTDLNNVDPADLMLGTLGSNGGSVPTIPLLPGSIAIDSGTTVAGLTTDARGVSRPQCSAYDSGAYEYNGTCPEPNNTTPLTYPDPITNSTVSLVLPSYVTDGTVSAISPTTIPKDTFFSYPLGLTSFQFNTTVGATKTITLYYDLPGDPGLYTPRKYNANTKTFSTINNATITRVTYNNKSMIRLTYDITDGGILDQDNVANGTIVDPVGLAAATVGVPNTGLGSRP